MTFNEYQKAAVATGKYKFIGHNITAPTLLLSEETGELAKTVHLINERKVHIHHREDGLRLAKDLGDILWCVALIAHEADLDLATIAKININKLNERYAGTSPNY